MHTNLRKKIPLALVSGGISLALVAGPGVPSASGTTGSPAIPASVDQAVNADAQAVFQAWLRHDEAAMSRRAEPAVVALLSARPSTTTSGWSSAQCDSGAGTTECTWARHGGELRLRVDHNTTGPPVAGAAFTKTGSNVAFWPFITATQARNTQSQVDQGHSPWMLDPEAVVEAYASADLHWSDVTLGDSGPDVYLVTDQDSGARVIVSLSQPARTGSSGIWAVDSVAASA